MVLTQYFIVVGCLVSGNVLLPGEDGGKSFGVCVQTVMEPFGSFPWMMLSCIVAMGGVKPRVSPDPPCLHPGGSHPRTQTMLPLAKDHPREPRMPPSPSPTSPTASRDCCSPLASVSAGPCKAKKGRGGEAEVLHSPAFPCSGLHNEDDGLNLHTSLRGVVLEPSLCNRESRFPEWLLPSSQQLWTSQVWRSSCWSTQASLGREGWECRGLGANVCLGQGCIWPSQSSPSQHLCSPQVIKERPERLSFP